MEKKERKSARLFYRRRLRFEIFRRDQFTCQYCGRNISRGIELTLEHVTLKSQGGEFSADNLVTACSDCNTGRWDDALNGFELRRLKELWGSMRPRPSIIVVAH